MYQGHWQHLDRHHPCQRDYIAFNGQPKHISTPTQVCVAEFVKRVEEWLSMRTQARNSKDDLVHVHGLKWKKIFFQLPYWVVGLLTSNQCICFTQLE